MADAAPAARVAGQTNRSQPALTFGDVSKVFPDGTPAFANVSFDIGSRDFVSVVGPSGCGKTTILKVASGLLAPTSGRVTRGTGSLAYVFQDPTLLPWRSIERNTELLLELQGERKAERQRLAKEALALVGLADFRNHLPRQLSGGMRMRASLARSLATKPEVFLFDEPFGSLDEITRERLNEELSSIFVLGGFAGLFVTHSIQEAVFISTRVLVMSPRPGRLVGDFEVPFDHPRSAELRYEARFAALANEVSIALRKASS